MILGGSWWLYGGPRVVLTGPRLVLGGSRVGFPTCLWSQLLLTTGALRFLLMELDLLPKLWIFLEEEREGCADKGEQGRAIQM